MSRSTEEWRGATDDSAIPPRVCNALGCDRPVRSKNAQYCEGHYFRLRRGSKTGLTEIRRHCLQCGKGLTRNKSKFCSDMCQNRNARGTPNTRSCRICSKIFPAWEQTAICSDECKRALMAANVHRRRARISGGERETFSAKEIFERDKWICQLCGKKTNRNVHHRHDLAPSLDHILPLKLGGGHTRANTQCTHLMCNFIKQGRAIGQLRMFG